MVREQWKNFDQTFVWENDYIKQEQTIKNKNSTLQLSVTLWAIYDNFIESEKLIFKCSSLITYGKLKPIKQEKLAYIASTLFWVVLNFTLLEHTLL